MSARRARLDPTCAIDPAHAGSPLQIPLRTAARSTCVPLVGGGEQHAHPYNRLRQRTDEAGDSYAPPQPYLAEGRVLEPSSSAISVSRRALVRLDPTDLVFAEKRLDLKPVQMIADIHPLATTRTCIIVDDEQSTWPQQVPSIDELVKVMESARMRDGPVDIKGVEVDQIKCV